MKANNTTIESALHLAFSPEYINALSLVELAETWSGNHNARDLELNIAAYAEQCTYKMEQEGATLEFDAWERLTAEIERIARVWVSLYCNEISWSNRSEWIANSVRAALNTTATPETPNPDNTPSTMNAKETRYNYLEAVTADVLDYINENNITVTADNREEIEEQLRDDLWACDSVTGNASGSYTFNAWQAEENICHNQDLFAEACDEFGSDAAELLRKGAEACDVTIRCYLLAQAIAAALDEVETEEDTEE